MGEKLKMNPLRIRRRFLKSMRQIRPRVKRYLVENPWASFILGFQILLLVGVGLLSVESYSPAGSELANGFAIGAYFSLVIGVILQLISHKRRGRLQLQLQLTPFMRDGEEARNDYEKKGERGR